MSDPPVFDLYRWHSERGIPMEIVINACIVKGIEMNFYKEYDVAKNKDQFVKLFTEAIRFTPLNKENAIKKITMYHELKS